MKGKDPLVEAGLYRIRNVKKLFFALADAAQALILRVTGFDIAVAAGAH